MRRAVIALAFTVGPLVLPTIAFGQSSDAPTEPPPIPLGPTDDVPVPDRDDAPSPPVSVDGTDVEVGVSTPDGTDVETGNPRTGVRGPRCSVNPVRGLEEGATDELPDVPGINRTHPATGVQQTWSVRNCPGQPPQYLWVDDEIDVAVIIQGAIAQAVGRLPTPVPAIDPSPAANGIVNLGMWLAVNDPGRIPVTASLGSVWATAVIDLLDTTYDLGNGDTVVCADAGTPIPDDARDSLEPSPDCGYVYGQSSPDDDPYRFTITSTYEVTWTASDGSSGNAGTYATRTTFDYDVDEVQTVGSR